MVMSLQIYRTLVNYVCLSRPIQFKPTIKIDHFCLARDKYEVTFIESMRLLEAINSNANMILPPILVMFLFIVSSSIISLPFSDVYAKEQCPSKLTSIIYSFSTYNLLLDPTGGYVMQIPLDWDSTIVNDQRTFYPCENPKVRMTITQFTGIDPSLSTEQIAQSHITRYVKSIDGYRVLGSHYMEGTRDFTVAATIGDSKSPTIWHGFIPIAGRTGPELFATTFSAGSTDMYEKYGAMARFIFDNFSPATESQVNWYLSTISNHNKIMGEAMAGIQASGQNAMDNWLDIMKQGVEFDHRMNQEDAYYHCQPSELGINPKC